MLPKKQGNSFFNHSLDKFVYLLCTLGGQKSRDNILVQNIYNFLIKKNHLGSMDCDKEINEELPLVRQAARAPVPPIYLLLSHRWYQVLHTNERVFNDSEVNPRALLMPQSQRETRLQMPSSSRVPGI